MITATGIELRAGARILIESASFRVATGDRIGLVGRNGAGKTTLTKVLAGEGQPAAGTDHPLRRGRLPAAGPAHRRPRRPRPRPHPVRPRPRRPCCARCARTRSAMAQRQGRHPREGDEEVLAPGDGVPHQGRLRRRGRGRHHRRRLGLPDRVLGQPLQHPLRRPAPPGRAGPDPVLRRRHAAARRADQPPRRRLDRLAARLPARPTTAASSSSPTTSTCVETVVNKVFYLDANRASIDVYNMGWKLYLAAARGRREAPQARARQRREEGRGAQLAGRQDARQGHQDRRRAEHGRAAPSSCSPASRRSGSSDKVAKLRFPEPGALRQDPADGRRACPSPTARWRSSPTSTWPSTGARGSSSSASTAPARPRCCGCSPASRSRTPARSSRATA